ncbi:hypothetical protein HK099_006110 [Clydaea vesicula]|uniref:Uncharacterized protein n=1 Tax=Clydaea vesicula TaxID=447962 RepID=A0AAD5XZ99_9FUNG|nr:hypothetical protein HK099_006110 [Clydaea vesicula]
MLPYSIFFAFHILLFTVAQDVNNSTAIQEESNPDVFSEITGDDIKDAVDHVESEFIDSLTLPDQSRIDASTRGIEEVNITRSIQTLLENINSLQDLHYTDLNKFSLSSCMDNLDRKESDFVINDPNFHNYKPNQTGSGDWIAQPSELWELTRFQAVFDAFCFVPIVNATNDDQPVVRTQSLTQVVNFPENLVSKIKTGSMQVNFRIGYYSLNGANVDLYFDFYYKNGSRVEIAENAFIGMSFEDSLNGRVWSNPVPVGAATMKIQIYGESSDLCIQYFGASLNKYRHEYEEEVLMSFVFAGMCCIIFILLTPFILFIQQCVKKEKKSIRMVDFVKRQGGTFFTMIFFAILALWLYRLNISFSVIMNYILKEKYQDAPINKFDPLKVYSGFVRVTFFLIGALLYLPILISFAHMTKNNRIAAILCFLNSCCFSVQRITFEYVSTSPRISAVDLAIVIGPEFAGLFYLIFMSFWGLAAPNSFERLFEFKANKDEKYVHDLLHENLHYFDVKKIQDGFFHSVKNRNSNGLLRKMKFWQKDSSIEEEVLKEERKFIRGDGPKKINSIRRQQIAFYNFDTPFPMKLIVLMTLAFTYQTLYTAVFGLHEINAQATCFQALAVGSSNKAYNLFFKTFLNIFGDIAEAISSGPLETIILDTLDIFYNEIRSLGEFVKRMVSIRSGSIYAAVVIVFLLISWNVWDLLVRFQFNLTRLRKGDYSWVKNGRNNPNLHMGNSIRYLGYQIGMSFISIRWTFFVFQMISYFIGYFIGFRWFREFVWAYIFGHGVLLIAIISSIVFRIIQKQIVCRFFLVEYEKPINLSTNFWLKRIYSYNLVEYLFLIINFVSGLAGFLGKLIKIFLVSGMFAFRNDYNFEYGFLDIFDDSSIYQSWVIEVHHYTNPILHQFLTICSSTVKETKNFNNNFTNPASLEVQQPRALNYGVNKQKLNNTGKRNSRARTRWFLLYTLVQNPGLVKYRSHTIKDTLLKNAEREYQKGLAAFKKNNLKMKV